MNHRPERGNGTMASYIIATPDGTVIGGVNHDDDDYKAAAEAVVNEAEWPDGTAAAEVTVAKVTDEDTEVEDELDLTDPGIELIEKALAVAVHD